MKKKIVVGLIFSAVAILSAACSGASDEPAVIISGLVDTTISAESLKSMDMIDVEFTEKDDSVSTYTGVKIVDVLDSAGISDFSVLTMIASDDYAADVTADELAACENCIIAPDGEGGWRSVLPGFSGKLQVKNLIELAVQ